MVDSRYVVPRHSFAESFAFDRQRASFPFEERIVKSPVGGRVRRSIRPIARMHKGKARSGLPPQEIDARGFGLRSALAGLRVLTSRSQEVLPELLSEYRREELLRREHDSILLRRGREGEFECSKSRMVSRGKGVMRSGTE